MKIQKTSDRLITGSDFNRIVDAHNHLETKVQELHQLLLQIKQSRPEQDTGSVSGSALLAMVIGTLSVDDMVNNSDAPSFDNQWAYSVHLIDISSSLGSMMPYDAAIVGRADDAIYPVWLVDGVLSFSNTDEYYRSGGIKVNGVPVRFYAYNTTEQYNRGTGIQGNGVDMTALHVDNPDMDIQPVPIGTIVIVQPVKVENKTVYMFSYENGIDGGCG